MIPKFSGFAPPPRRADGNKMVRTAETTFSAALAAAVLTLAAVSGAALEQCSLCRRSFDRNCLPGGIKESSRLKSVDPRGSGSAFVVSLSIGSVYSSLEDDFRLGNWGDTYGINRLLRQST